MSATKSSTTLDRSIRFGVSRGHGGAHLLDAARHFAEALATRLGGPVQLIVANDYDHLLDSVMEGGLELAWMPPLLQARAAGAKPVAVCERGGITVYRSAILVHADSSYHTVADLVGARAAWSDPNSASGYLFPRLHLRSAGIDPSTLHETLIGSPASAMSAIIDGTADVCACFVTDAAGTDSETARTDVQRVFAPAAWRLRVLEVTETIPPDGFVLRPQMAIALASTLQRTLLTLCDQPQGAAAVKELLNADRLVPVTEAMARLVERLRIHTAR